MRTSWPCETAVFSFAASSAATTPSRRPGGGGRTGRARRGDQRPVRPTDRGGRSRVRRGGRSQGDRCHPSGHPARGATPGCFRVDLLDRGRMGQRRPGRLRSGQCLPRRARPPAPRARAGRHLRGVRPVGRGRHGRTSDDQDAPAPARPAGHGTPGGHHGPLAGGRHG